MRLVTRSGPALELTPLRTDVVVSRRTGNVRVEVAVDRRRDPVSTNALVARASRRVFEIGRRAKGAAPAPAPKGPPPQTFRDEESGAIKVVYREIVVRFARGTPEARRRAILGALGFAVRRRNPYARDQVVVYHPRRKYGGQELVEIANRWTALDEVVFATPNFVSQYWRQAPSPAFPRAQWHLENGGASGARRDEDVDARVAWRITRGRPSIVVAVLDDGVDLDHPNLAPRLWRNPDAKAKDKHGRDFFVGPDDPGRFDPRPKVFADPYDDMALNDIHGTPCAGVIAAAGARGGAIGIAPRCRLLAVKVFHADALAPDERVADAIRWSAKHAAILSCSWSGGYSDDLHQAIEDVATAGRGGLGTLVFCAAGNNEHRPVEYPARDPLAVAVGASTDEGKLAWYSAVGNEVAFVAPSNGGRRGIYTTDVSLPTRGFNLGTAAAGGADGRHTNDFGGTSSATPLAAGVAALMLSARPGLTREQVVDLMRSTCDRIGTGYDADGHSDRYGHGRINAGNAVKAAKASKSP
jgi:subtilisin family serine protease